MATSVRSSSQNSSTTGTAISVSAPTGTTTGDLVIIAVHGNGQTTIVDNNGSTAFTEDLNDYKPNTTAGHTFSLFSRRILAGDPSTYNFTLGATGRWSIIAVTFQDPNASTIYDAAISTAATDGADTVNAPSVTTVTDNAIHCVIGTHDDGVGDVTGTPAGYTAQQETTNEPMAFCTKAITPAGPTGAQTFNFNSSTGVMGISFAIASVAASTVKKLAALGVG